MKRVLGEARALTVPLTLLPLMLGVASSPSVAQDPLPITRLAAPLDLDGVVNEDAWEGIEPLPMIVYSPVFGGANTERTEIRLAHDDEYFYLSGRLYDSDPTLIRTNTLYRDLYSGDDLLAIVIDSYNDYETAVWFVTNPAGVRNDRTMSNDAEFTQGMPMNADWNSYWDVWTSIDDDGWAAEMRIPFSTLGFQVVAGEVTMGVIAYRLIARKNERHLFPSIEPKWGPLGFAKPSQARRVTMRGIRQSKPVYLTPFALGGETRVPILSSHTAGSGTSWTSEGKATRELGLDLRASPTSNLSLDLTVNTDFAQVEADDRQVNLTRFPLFFPEKRQFFQERASTFQFNTGGFTDRLFHSRRIGLDGGEIVRIYGGVRAVGRLGGLDFGILDMQTAGAGGESTENVGVIRLNQQVLNPYSSVGGMFTSRLGVEGRGNLAYGLDASIRPIGDEYVIFKLAGSNDQATEEGGLLDASLLFARWERRTDEGFSYYADIRRVGPDFTPGLGFQARRNFVGYGGGATYAHLMPDDSPLERVSFAAEGGSFLRLIDGSAESHILEPEVNFDFRTGHGLVAGLTSSFESIDNPFAIGDAIVPTGEYWFHEARAEFQFPRSTEVRGNFSAAAGSFYDGTRIGLVANPIFTMSRHLEIGGGYEVNRISFDERRDGVTTHVGRLRAQLAYDAHLSLTAFAQYSNLADLTSVNVRLRYHFREGTDLWLVWNEGFNTIRANGLGPRLPLSAGRVLMVKYSHALVL